MRKGSKRASITSRTQQLFVKEGPLLKLSSGRLRRWQRRHFRLESHYLKYFADTATQTVKGALDLREVQSCTREGDEMVLATRNGDVFKYKAVDSASSESIADWVEVIRKLVIVAEAMKPQVVLEGMIAMDSPYRIWHSACDGSAGKSETF